MLAEVNGHSSSCGCVRVCLSIVCVCMCVCVCVCVPSSVYAGVGLTPSAYGFPVKA